MSIAGASRDRRSAAALLTAHLARETAQLRKQEARVRADRPDAVHKMRVAARKLRSALASYRPLIAPAVAAPIREDLQWLGQTLGRPRDAQVLRARLRALTSSEPVELLLGPVIDRIETDLCAEYRAGQEEVLRALRSDRYLRLLDALDDLVEPFGLLPAAAVPAEELVPRLLRRDAKRLRRAVRSSRVAEPGCRDGALHQVRKKAKRLRYSAESAVPVYGRQARALATRAQKIQQVLGEHQDAVVAQHTLREYGIQAHLGGENAFTFGRLHAREQARAVKAERRFDAAWRDLRRRPVRRWLDGPRRARGRPARSDFR